MKIYLDDNQVKLMTHIYVFVNLKIPPFFSPLTKARLAAGQGGVWGLTYFTFNIQNLTNGRML